MLYIFIISVCLDIFTGISYKTWGDVIFLGVIVYSIIFDKECVYIDILENLIRLKNKFLVNIQQWIKNIF
jgi:hypothetical protein